MKHIICTVGGVLGGIVAALFGGWTEGLLVLVILMAIDYFSGLVVAGIFHNSPKSPGGGLESKAGLKGLIRKVAVLALVAVAHLIDRLIGTSYVRDAAAIAFCLNEVISILENAGLMGVPIPRVLRKAIDVLREKAGEDAHPPDEGTGTDSSAADGLTEKDGYIVVYAYSDYDEDGNPVVYEYEACEDCDLTQYVDGGEDDVGDA